VSRTAFIARLGGALLTVALGGVVLAESAPPSAGVRDLHYGEALFQLFQQRNFTAITHLQMAQAQGLMQAQGDEPALILGGLYLAYGLHDEAEPLFERLLARAAKPVVRDRAWLQLARLHQQQRRTERAATAFEQIGEALPEPLQHQRRELAGLIALAQGAPGLAAAQLQSTAEDDDWQGFHLFNRALAEFGQGRQQAGRALLQQLSQLDADDEEHRALRDRANLLLGLLLLEAGENAAAQAPLQRVRLQGIHSNRALLALGWAAFRQQQFEQALSPWQALAARAPADPAVQQALLLIPQALQQLQAESEALKRYRQALDSYKQELAALDQALQAVAGGALLPTLSTIDETSSVGDLPPAADPVLQRRLFDLLAQHRFRQAYQDYLDLGFLHTNLSHWSATIESYDQMLAVRQSAYTRQLPRAEAALSDQSLQSLRQRHDELLEKEHKLAGGSQPMRLADAKEQAQLVRIESIERRLDTLGDVAGLEEKRQRLRLMKGLLRWQVESDFKPRFWQFSKDLRSVNTELEQSERQRQRLQQAVQQAPGRFKGFAMRIDALKARIAELQPALNQTLQAQADELKRLASESLQQRKVGLDGLRARARFALAQLQDRAASRAGATP